MRLTLPSLALLGFGLAGVLLPAPAPAETTNYFVHGTVKAVNWNEHQLVIAHEKVPNFMDAMTMPFNLKDPSALTNLGSAIGAPIAFQLHVTETESWIDHIERLNVPESASLSAASPQRDAHSGTKTNSAAATVGHANNPLRYYKFTNELGQAASLSDFRGQALALTFFYTRCPIPDFCPRLSRNFQEVEQKLTAMADAPTNWHLLSVTFDPAHDTPEALKAYGAAYHYDPAHWSFWTGPEDKIADLARLCDVTFQADNGTINHNFRTLIIDASNHLQMVFPTSGNLSDPIVQELLKATRGSPTSENKQTSSNLQAVGKAKER